MADLARLRAIALSGDLTVNLTAAILHHLSPDQSETTRYGIADVREVMTWLSRAPGQFYGDVVAATGVTPAILSAIVDEMDDAACADAATMANAMATPDAEWDREHRNRFTTALATHSADAARLAAQSSAEFAALDSLVEAGYANEDHARTAVNEMNRAYGVNYRVLTRQRARSCVAIAVKYRLPDLTTAHILTPWCLSRTAAMAYVAVVARHIRRQQSEARAGRIARTALSYASRSGLDAVRSVVEPAVAILTSFRYDAERLAFVDTFDRERESITTRASSVLVAFACIHMCGETDVLIRAAQLRADVVPDQTPPHPSVVEYTETVDDEQTGLLMFSRLLHAARAQRDQSRAGPRVNKDLMLGYVARGKKKSERNTMACINRVEEAVSLLRSKKADVLNTLFVIEWGGEFDYPTVMAALAVARLDVCVDIGPSGIDLPGADVVADDTPEEYNYSLLISSAEERMMPRMPRISYPKDEPLESKLLRVAEFYCRDGRSNIAYISGGTLQHEGTPVSVCVDTNNRLDAIRNATAQVPINFACAEALIPPLCPHGAQAPLEEYLDTSSLIDEECPNCNAHYRSVALLSAACAKGHTRVVKPRSSYAHNFHVSLELVPGHPTCPEDTLTTIDSMVAANVCRNADWGDTPNFPLGGGNPSSENYRKLNAITMKHVYACLSSVATGPFDYDDMASIAASIAP
ncbi:hypothetical protein QK581_sRNA4gp1 [Aspergillus spelaeus tetramycovirus 1]|uniref:Uncharacterized protein n=1 Tax=Aspergillus spelaeus tetramycovirus 1 TaxID=2485922 RepID=A0A3G3C4N7_9VIRU|nr:hypothetical protein QK581_sRNA4gp1 [Aspergillus spelaeus tetramycovirus 1]AYP71808.1 hypothetical protein [Aspergillus spelaeus tetramycovirus 1]